MQGVTRLVPPLERLYPGDRAVPRPTLWARIASLIPTFPCPLAGAAATLRRSNGGVMLGR